MDWLMESRVTLQFFQFFVVYQLRGSWSRGNSRPEIDISVQVIHAHVLYYIGHM
jgi:hypothetical protein